MNSESVKPLLSAEEIEKRAESYAGLMVWINKHEEESQEFYEYISAASYKAGAEWAVSQLQPSSPQLEQEVKPPSESVELDWKVKNKDAHLQLHYQIAKAQFNNLKMSSDGKAIDCSSASHAIVDYIIWRESSQLQEVKRLQEENESMMNFFKITKALPRTLVDENEKLQSRIKELEQRLSQSSTLEEGQKDPEQ